MKTDGLQKLVGSLLSMLAIAALPGYVGAAPVLIDYSSVTANTFEDFESLGPGNLVSPATFAGFDYTVNEPQVISSGIFCGSSDDQCLTNQSVAGVRLFDNFAVGVTQFGFDLHKIVLSTPNTDTLIFTVTGNSGVLNFNSASLVGLIAFEDATGLVSVSLENSGSRNYAFDDVITNASGVIADASVVPIPAAAWLFLSGLAGLGFIGRRNRKA